MTLNEAGVVSLGDFKQKKSQEQIDRTNQQIQNAHSRYTYDIDVAVETAIELLEAHGMSNDNASKFIYSHLSDLVMAHDLSKG